MRSKKLTDAQVEAEIKRMNASEAVKLARRENDIKYRRQRYMKSLRQLERRGLELISMGITFENIEERLFGEVTPDG